MSAIIALIAVLALIGAGYAAGQSQVTAVQYVFAVIVPGVAIVTFLVGVVLRVLSWAKVPVPFRVPTTCGQQKSLPFIKNDPLESPHNTLTVLGRMLLEVLLFRSLFRNTKTELHDGPKVTHGPTKWLWGAGLLFHYSFLLIFLRHFKFFVEPVPQWVLGVQALDSFFQIGLPILYITDVLLVVGVTYLLIRRLFIPQVRYISLASDYFPLLLILGIAGTGIFMRYFTKIDILGVKELATGLMTLHPVLPEQPIGALFFAHLLLVSVLMAYFPFSKLMHMGGVFFSPTRNLANNNRAVRHINPWNYPVKVHTYEEYEDDFRDLMKAAELPLERDEPQAPAATAKGKEE